MRQGCPYSKVLFVISSIPLIQMIKDESGISGYKTKRNNIVKIQSHADDNTVIIKKPAELQTVLKVYEKHAKASEAMINQEKTESFGIGDIEEPKEKNFQEKLKDRVRILGVFFCRNKQNQT